MCRMLRTSDMLRSKMTRNVLRTVSEISDSGLNDLWSDMRRTCAAHALCAQIKKVGIAHKKRKNALFMLKLCTGNV